MQYNLLIIVVITIVIALGIKTVLAMRNRKKLQASEVIDIEQVLVANSVVYSGVSQQKLAESVDVLSRHIRFSNSDIIENKSIEELECYYSISDILYDDLETLFSEGDIDSSSKISDLIKLIIVKDKKA